MASKPTDSQELKLGPGWTSLSKSTLHSSTPTTTSTSVTSAALQPSAPRIAYTKAQLLELYEPGSTATIPPAMTKYPGLTSSEPLVPVNIAPDDHIAHVSALVESTDPPPARSRFQSAPPRAGVEAILGRDHAPASATVSSSTVSPPDAPSASPPPKKPGHVTSSSRDFWSGSAVLAPAERPSTSGSTALERRPLPLKPRSTAPDRAPSPNGNPPEKPSSQQPYWSRSSGRTAADSNANWRGGSSSVATGSAKYPGSSNEDLSNNVSGVAAERVGQARRSSDFSGTSTSTRSGFSRDGGLFSRNNKDTLKPTNTRDLSALTKGSSRDPASSSSSLHPDREARTYNAENSHRNQYEVLSDQRKLWFYKDPQNVSQGPFTASQIMEWHKAGYYNEELPVSKNREHGFKALAVAFGLRKEEAPVRAPPPGFVKEITPSKKDGQNSNAGSSSNRSSREDRTRRAGRTVEELAQEVEMMRLQNHRKSQEKAPTKSSENNESRKEKSFFDIDNLRDKKMNGHDVLDGPLEKAPAKPTETSAVKAGEDVVASGTKYNAPDEKAMDMPVIASSPVPISVPMQPSTLPKTVERLGPESPPPKQSRLAAFMGQELTDDENKSSKLPVGSSALKEPSSTSVLPEISRSLVSGTVPSSTNIRPPVQSLPIESMEPGRLNETAIPSSSWKNIMAGMHQQQQNGHTRTVPVSQTTTEQDLMAIDPAIAHASFARPSPPVSSDLNSTHVSNTSQELPSWLRFSAAAESNPVSHRHDSLHDANHTLSTQHAVQNRLGTPNAAQELGVLQDPGMHTRTDYQAIEHARRAQVAQAAQAQAAQAQAAQAQAAQAQAAQAQAAQAQMRKIQVQQQLQAQIAASQRTSALAPTLQLPLQPSTQIHASARDKGWVLQHQLSQYQHHFELQYRAHLESTRTAQTARAAAATVGVGDPDQQSYLTVAARAEAVAKNHALLAENIKVYAGTTHAELVRFAQEQQHQREFQAQTAQLSKEAFISGNNMATSHNGIQSPNPPISTGQLNSSISPSAFSVKRTDGMHTVEDHGPGVQVDQGHQNRPLMQRNFNESYDPMMQGDAQDWERVSRRTKANGTGTTALRSAPTNLSDVNTDINRGENRDHTSLAAQIPGHAPSKSKPDEDIQNSTSDANAHSHQPAEVARSERNPESSSTIAPWSKASAQGAANGLSLREIQRQEEMRSKTSEKVTNTPPERDDARVAPARWNTMQPWGGAGDPSKQRTMSLREQMRYEEEQQKKNASLARESAPSTNGPTLGTKTGWASLVANSKPPSSRQHTTVTGRKMDDETSFWDSVGTGNHSASAGRRTQKSNIHQSQGQTQPVQVGVQANRQPTTQTSSSLARRPPSPTKTSKNDRRDGGSEVVIGKISNEFAKWCTDNLQELTGNPNQDTTLVEYLVNIKSPSEIRDTVVQNLGATDKARSFADEFIRRLEFEKPTMVADAGNGGSAGRRKGRRQRAAKVDPSLVLGFTSTSSSSRIMQGTIETPEMK
ncbi:GYF-like protein [Gracilaria domingensis]|nr:GYF-like protein [Gracilaria domingensis]